MSDRNGVSHPSAARGPLAVSRRVVALELAGIAIVLAVPVGAVIKTANPIPNPPSRKTLQIMPPERMESEEQQRAAEQEKRRAKRQANKKRTKDSGSRRETKQRRRSRATEQSASQP